jgi:DNA-binding NtrC family response regulator
MSATAPRNQHSFRDRHLRPRVLLADDRAENRQSFATLLEHAGMDVVCCKSLSEAEQLVRTEPLDVIFADVRMGADDDGMHLLKLVRSELPRTPVILYTGHARIRDAVLATKLGAVDYLELPLDPDSIVAAVSTALDRVAHPNARVVDVPRAAGAFDDVVAASAAMRAVVDWAARIGPTDLPALLLGETGTGKELIARALHRVSERRSGPFVAVNCGAIPEGLCEAELFGFRKGAFTGAFADKPGLVEEANRGTLFLDEVGELPLPMQVQLLRFLEQAEVRRLGETRLRHVNVRIISATNRDLQKEVANGRFRSDLFFRLNVGHCQLPPLRSRPEDLEALIRLWLPSLAGRLGSNVKTVSTAGLLRLLEHSWPGNARELRSALEHAIGIARTEELTEVELSFAIGQEATATPSLELPTDQNNENPRRQLLLALQRHHWKVGRAAASLGMSRSTLWRRLKRYGIRADDE